MTGDDHPDSASPQLAPLPDIEGHIGVGEGLAEGRDDVLAVDGVDGVGLADDGFGEVVVGIGGGGEAVHAAGPDAGSGAGGGRVGGLAGGGGPAGVVG